MNLNGVRVLLTQNDIYSINGSAVIILELAQFLINAGASVTVYTYFLENPLKDIFNKNGILVTESEDTLSLDDFDYIWVHQQVLPLSIINELESIHMRRKVPIFIFNHMSPLDYIPDEFPYIWNLENNLSSLSLFHSSFTKELQEDLLSKDILKDLYPNPAPSSFARSSRSRSERIESILVVSNHPPKEIIDLKSKFKDADVELVLLGEALDRYDLISAELIGQYDLVISIGKTVQNCLVSGTPVYIYDHFGGPGYLNESNYDLAEHRNFSRGFDKKTTDVLYDDIVAGYNDACEFIEKRREDFIYKFTIDRAVDRVLRKATKRAYAAIDMSYASYLKYAHNYSREHRIAARQRMVYKQELEAVRRELDACKDELESVKNSKSYRLGNKIAEPLRKVKTLRGDA